MLLFDLSKIGNKLYSFRKCTGMTQAEVAETANISDRTYADIERGSVNMRVETLLRICKALHITPDDVLTQPENETSVDPEEIFMLLNNCAPKDRETAFHLLFVYLNSLS